MMKKAKSMTGETKVSLGTVIASHREIIRRELIQRLARLPESPYQEFSQSEKGSRRIQAWIWNIMEAVGGKPEIFFADTEKIGYLRAHQGYELDFVVSFYRIFKQILWEILERQATGKRLDLSAYSRDLHELDDILFQGLRIVTSSYLKTREEIIREKVAQLQRLSDEIEQSRQEMRFLAGKTITIQEEERRRLSGEIHDTITQSLTGIGYKIQYCKEMIKKDPDGIADRLDSLLETVHGAIDQSRAIISSLRPDLLDTLGLVPALRRHIEKVEKETGIRIRTRLPKNLEMSPEINICLFRMVQEALMNVYKHAQTQQAEVSLGRTRNVIRLTVADRGIGFDPLRRLRNPADKTRMGLLMLRERVESAGGELTIDAAPGGGCRLEARIHLP